MAADEPADKPAVLIIGGLGYTGRFLAKHIHDNNLASEIRLVDKHLPELAWLAPEFKDVCTRERFVQADASREQSFPRIFDRPSGKQFDFVFNCGGETRFSQEDDVYKLRTYGLSLAMGAEAARRRIPVFIESSTGMVTAHVYGPYTSKFLGTALCMARVYQALGKEMKWLWKEDLRTNTVHVEDVARALWTGAQWYVDSKQATPRTFNLVDHGNTSQRTMAALMHDAFKIETGFHGTLINTFARMNLDHVVDEVNDETLDPWADLQQDAGISNSTPLTPFMEKELLRDTDLSLDGGLFEEEVGFRYQHESLTLEEVERVIASYKAMGWWP
ncbi:hypothetical protein GRF29_77g2216622 [Pseudopithomyces chartarum]|uniref:NAD-dependent epimerase/dehydratase domain-containing protein n=1 Tax=Pseudopithomyces chartarum TaxID=1892770 RepID=A0AAN6RHH0_9PLEO|nr:hypothetical protein GRF29_77g2216622 [Pseudopithomyces chartarum]